MLAARVLSDHATEVVILEPDAAVSGGTGRGAPHKEQLHALLSMGHTQLERLFPGISKELIEGGARLGTGPAVQYYIDGVLKPCVPESTMLGATRPFIEEHVRRRVLALENVNVLAAQARDLVFSGSRVSGVRLSSMQPGLESLALDELEADLVVDAMGRSSRLGTWLVNHGWQQPPMDRMTVDLGYATAMFRRGAELPETVIAHASPGPASDYQQRLSEPGALAAVEGDRWSVVLVGYNDYRPGHDPREFRRRMRRCVAPLREVAEQCELDGSVQTFTFRESQRRNFTRLRQFPGGLVVVGDAVASVNPIYGQGLTLAALAATSLSAHLQSGASPHQPARGYFERVRAVVDAAWQLSTTADLAQPHVTGPYPRGYRLIRWAGDRVTAASVIDPVVNKAFMDVIHMREHPRALTRTRILARTARVLAQR
ncbi:hypothetical protein [Streptomyces sp. NPDC002215]|uniref:NAD(P)/FAD-dependent oxidoreductase n=1 Tax=Streptomyces sp. NPDC002215 TaxID=3154412 RepID=UPI0033249ED9